MAYEIERQRLLDPSTPEGQHNLVLAETGDKQQAEDVLVKCREAVKLKGLEGMKLENEQI
jgi:hypothetical protein